MIKRYTDTAYPVLNSRFSAKTLRETYTPTLEELALISRFHKPMLKIGFLLHLKLYQRLGYVMALDQVPKALVRHNITAEILAGTSPYRMSSINRFGDYPLDIKRNIEPINFEMKIINRHDEDENT